MISVLRAIKRNDVRMVRKVQSSCQSTGRCVYLPVLVLPESATAVPDQTGSQNDLQCSMVFDFRLRRTFS